MTERKAEVTRTEECRIFVERAIEKGRIRIGRRRARAGVHDEVGSRAMSYHDTSDEEGEIVAAPAPAPATDVAGNKHTVVREFVVQGPVLSADREVLR